MLKLLGSFVISFVLIVNVAIADLGETPLILSDKSIDDPELCNTADNSDQELDETCKDEEVKEEKKEPFYVAIFESKNYLKIFHPKKTKTKLRITGAFGERNFTRSGKSDLKVSHRYWGENELSYGGKYEIDKDRDDQSTKDRRKLSVFLNGDYNIGGPKGHVTWFFVGDSKKDGFAKIVSETKGLIGIIYDYFPHELDETDSFKGSIAIGPDRRVDDRDGVNETIESTVVSARIKYKRIREKYKWGFTLFAINYSGADNANSFLESGVRNANVFFGKSIGKNVYLTGNFYIERDPNLLVKQTDKRGNLTIDFDDVWDTAMSTGVEAGKAIQELLKFYLR